MTRDEYARFTQLLLASLESDEDVVGLVALGSMAAVDYEPDRWSDHDFFVVVRSGAQERFRTALGWLPDFEDVVLAFRETEHGVKALYHGGHLVEFAVFDLGEITLARVNRYRVLLDRGMVADRLAAVREATVSETAKAHRDDAFLVGMFLTNLLVGVGRHARGERLSGSKFVKCHATGHLVALGTRHLTSERRDVLDDLDAFRRLEAAFPEFARAVGTALERPVPDAAHDLLVVARTYLGACLEAHGGDAARALDAVLLSVR